MRSHGRIIAVVGVAIVLATVAAFVLADPMRPTPEPPTSPSPGPSSSAAAAVDSSSDPPAPTMHLDGLATVTAQGGLPLRQEPAGRKVKGAAATIAHGTTVFLDSERVTGEGVTWWAVQPTKSFSFGWVPAADARGTATLVPLEPECPPIDTLDAATIRRLGTLTALVCYGRDDLALRGEVTCSAASVDGGIAGASWLPLYAICNLDDALNLDGHLETTLLSGQPSPPNAVRDEYAVVGHFDDIESRLCFSIGFGGTVSGPVNEPEPAAVLGCRQQFVVTSLTPMP